MHILFFDRPGDHSLYPLTMTRPASELRMGILTGSARWLRRLSPTSSSAWLCSAEYLRVKYPLHMEADNILICGTWIADVQAAEAVRALAPGQAWIDARGHCLAARLDRSQAEEFAQTATLPPNTATRLYDQPYRRIEHIWQLFVENQAVLEQDFELLCSGRKSAPLPPSNTLIGDPGRVFLEENAKVQACTLNPGPSCIYLGEDSEMMEGTLVRGGLALCQGAQTKLGTKIYGATTIGPYSKVGGEVNNSVILGCSNKGHDGFLGNSVLGEWCNLGAGTNNSNLKNNYGNVELWSYERESFVDTGLQFCGLIMGDHSKCGINTMFNTGTVVGVFANIFGAGFPRKFIPSFSWGGAKGFETYALDKAYETAALVMQRRQTELIEADRSILQAIFRETAARRHWDRVR